MPVVPYERKIPAAPAPEPVVEEKPVLTPRPVVPPTNVPTAGPTGGKAA